MSVSFTEFNKEVPTDLSIFVRCLVGLEALSYEVWPYYGTIVFESRLQTDIKVSDDT